MVRCSVLRCRRRPAARRTRGAASPLAWPSALHPTVVGLHPCAAQKRAQPLFEASHLRRSAAALPNARPTAGRATHGRAAGAERPAVTRACQRVPPPSPAPCPCRPVDRPFAPLAPPRLLLPAGAMFALTWLPSLAASAAASCACACCTQVTSTALRSSARMAWSLLFSASLIVAWIARDFGATLLKKLPCAWPGWLGKKALAAAGARQAGSGSKPQSGGEPACAVRRRPPLTASLAHPPHSSLLLQGWCATSRAATCPPTPGLGSRRCTASPWATL